MTNGLAGRDAEKEDREQAKYSIRAYIWCTAKEAKNESERINSKVRYSFAGMMLFRSALLCAVQKLYICPLFCIWQNSTRIKLLRAMSRKRQKALHAAHYQRAQHHAEEYYGSCGLCNPTHRRR